MLLAHLEGDAEALARLVAQAELWENPYLAALLAELKGDEGLLEGLSGFFPSLTRAYPLLEVLRSGWKEAVA